jgi:O-antigen/teichoic acid export membrane protein
MIKNIFANYVGKLWSFISIYLFVPIYINLLGIESYAIINFYSVLLSILLIADAGLSATLNRELAKSENKIYQGNLVRTIEYLYFIIAFFLFLFVYLFSETISDNFLNSENITQEKLTLCIKLMGASISFQLLSILYNSGLMGLQKQVKSNTIQFFSSLFRQGFVLLPLYFFKTLEVFFIWQLIINIIFFLISREALWRYIKNETQPFFKKKIIKDIGRFTLGMMAMSVIAALNTQLDKLLVSNMLSLKTFGYYSIASILAQSPSILILPIAVAILPRMTKMIAKNQKSELQELFHNYSFIIASIASTITLILFLYTKDFIYIWTNDLAISSEINYVSKVLLIGGLFLSLQYMPFHLAIANGHTKTNIVLGLILAILIAPSLYFSINSYGLIGATFPWLILNIIATFYLGYFIIKIFLIGNFKVWLFKDTMLPVLVSLFVGILAFTFISDFVVGYNVLIIGSIIGFINLLLCALIFIKFYLNLSLKQFVITYVKK